MALAPERRRYEPLISRYLELIRSCVSSRGIVLESNLPPSSREYSYLPGVVLTALATCQQNQGVWILKPSQYRESLSYYRHCFGLYPRWPDIWWQLRAWSAIDRFLPIPPVSEFVESMVLWALSYQLRSGAFLTWEWPTAPSFQTACVAEGLTTAARVLKREQSFTIHKRLIRSTRCAVEFCSSLVVDERHSGLFPSLRRSCGGVRSWHGGIELRTDAAGHYVHALVGYRDLLADYD